MLIENENNFKAALRDGLNLFLGAGFPILAHDREGRPLPLGGQLRDELISRFQLQRVATLNLSQICTILESGQRNALYEFLRERFSVTGYDPAYKALEIANIKNVFTTNIDDLLPKLFEHSAFRYLNDVARRGPSLRNREAVDYIALHGSVLHPEEPITFSSVDLAAAFASDPDRWHLLTGELQKRPTVFWGYSVADAGVLQALNPGTVRGRAFKDRWIVLHDPSGADVEYFQALGFQTIVGDTKELLRYLAENAAASPLIGPSSNTKDIFPDESLPSAEPLAVRPLIEFFMGAPPTWADIYSGRIPKTQHFNRVMNAVNSGKDTVVLGIPASGKTTLMMQVAAEFQGAAHVLISTLLTSERARFILNKLAGEKAVFFVDDFADSIDAFNVLVEAANVLAVGFDRDLNFDMVSHLVDRERLNVLEVSNLSARDAQAIFSLIPQTVRVPSFSAPTVEEGATPSIYEFIESNITEANLSSRYAPMLTKLEAESARTHDLLVMCCYVHACRTPVSMDMALAFLRGLVTDYQEVYEMFDRLRNLIVGYPGQLADSEQDHFIARSSLFSDAILGQVRPSAFKRVLLRFHEHVSPFRIARFDIFRRRAFDERFARTAFPNWLEGKDFYQARYLDDKSPYLKQQGALYLAHKKHYDEAFQWIDEAVTETRFRVFSIRNSHAIILFKANIDKPESETKRATLQQSMTILSDCYRNDKRKVYHATAFADQALQYFNVYGDEPEAREYLNTAQKWLREENRKAPWNRAVRWLLRQVDRVSPPAANQVSNSQ